MDPTKFFKDHRVQQRKLEEAAYEQALLEFQSGQLRTGLMAKAIAGSGGDEAKAKSDYIQMAVKSILDDHYIAQRNTAPHGDGPTFLMGALSFFIPGLGQLAQGRVGPAIGFFAGAWILWVLLLGWIIHIWAMINAASFERDRHNHTSRENG